MTTESPVGIKYRACSPRFASMGGPLARRTTLLSVLIFDGPHCFARSVCRLMVVSSSENPNTTAYPYAVVAAGFSPLMIPARCRGSTRMRRPRAEAVV